VTSLYLLDTHTFLWMNSEPQRLGAARDIIADPTSELLLSAVVSWEICIKWALGRLPLPSPPKKWLTQRSRDTGTVPLDITLEHTLGVAELPPHHADPFDRLLIAQAVAENVPIITADRMLEKYEVDLVLIG
jgi:PIN domain nuclease of toxin-antitoxin system